MSALNDSQQRLMKLLVLLSADVVQGSSNADLARQLGVAPPVITRDLTNAQAAGFAVQNPLTQRWSPGPELVAIAVRGQRALLEHQQKLQQLSALYSGS